MHRRALLERHTSQQGSTNANMREGIVVTGSFEGLFYSRGALLQGSFVVTGLFCSYSALL